MTALLRPKSPKVEPIGFQLTHFTRTRFGFLKLLKLDFFLFALILWITNKDLSKL